MISGPRHSETWWETHSTASRIDMTCPPPAPTLLEHATIESPHPNIQIIWTLGGISCLQFPTEGGATLSTLTQSRGCHSIAKRIDWCKAPPLNANWKIIKCNNIHCWLKTQQICDTGSPVRMWQHMTLLTFPNTAVMDTQHNFNERITLFYLK